MALLERLNDLIWGLPLLVLLMGTHIYFTVKLHFPQRNLLYALKLSLGKADNEGLNLSPFSALATTLAATLGTGNIIGVSTAVALGGPGAIFWCWITGILGMATAYSECYLSVLFRSRNEEGAYVGGPMYVLKNGLHNAKLGSLYAICTLTAAFGVGCTTQANSVTQAASASFGLSPHLVGIVLAFLTGTVILGGVRSIAGLCERSVPAISFIYLFGCGLLLILYRHVLPDACLLIIKDAFSFGSLAGGMAGSALQHAVRYGIARGLFTNEAGIGTSAIAAAASHAKNPRIQAYVSMTAVFWDTVVMCLITGLVIVSNMLYDPASTAGVPETGLTAAAFAHLPYVGDAFLTISLAAFAVTTLIGWSYFGEKATEYLVGKKGIPLYKTAYIVMIYLGAIIPMRLVWESTDLINALMVLPNVLALYCLRRQIRS
ncbi:MAG: sodium:alanine symporter family protein [Lachnospiraceae bacterium]|nr:sodium:alanine symporter family protein [Lachnospiraceae bacterium]